MKTEELGSKFKLIIKRNDNVTGAALKTHIVINDEEHFSLGHNNFVESFEPRGYTKIKLQNKVFLGRNIEKELVVDPLLNDTVEVLIWYKMNWLSLIPPFTFLIPTSSIKTKILYFKE